MQLFCAVLEAVLLLWKFESRQFHLLVLFNLAFEPIIIPEHELGAQRHFVSIELLPVDDLEIHDSALQHAVGRGHEHLPELSHSADRSRIESELTRQELGQLLAPACTQPSQYYQQIEHAFIHRL